MLRPAGLILGLVSGGATHPRLAVNLSLRWSLSPELDADKRHIQVLTLCILTCYEHINVLAVCRDLLLGHSLQRTYI